MDSQALHNISLPVERPQYGQPLKSFNDLNYRTQPSSTESSKPLPSPDLQNKPLPINKTVSNASTQFSAESTINPSLVAKITEQVIKSLQSVDCTAAASSDGQQLFSHCQSYPESPLSSYQSSSISTDTSTSFRPVYTPPSRIRQACRMNDPSESKTSISTPGLSEPDSNFSYGANGRSIPLAISETSHVSQTWPRQFSAVSDLEDGTPIERTSQLLFDSESRPTRRLSQYLRGLANHIVRIKPKHCLVFV